MKRLLIFLLFASVLSAKERDYRLYAPNVPGTKEIEIILPSLPDPPQTNTFCAAGLACTVTGAWSFSAGLNLYGNVNIQRDPLLNTHLVIYPVFANNNSQLSLVPHPTINPGANPFSMFELFTTDWTADQTNFSAFLLKTQDSNDGNGPQYFVATDASGTGTHYPINIQQAGVNIAHITSSGGAPRVMIANSNLGDAATTALEVNGDFSLKARGQKIILGLGSSGTEWITNDAATGDILFFAGSAEKVRLLQGGGWKLPEIVAPSGIASSDLLWPDSTAHRFKMNNNNTGADVVVGAATTDTLSNKSTAAGPLTGTVASGTATMTTAAITAGNCGTPVTVAATGVATADTITWAFNAAPAGSNAGLVAWPTANNVNFAYCPNTAETPAAATINWRVVR